MIFKNCNDKSLVTCKMSSRNINAFITEGRFFWLRQMGRYNKYFQKFHADWNITIIWTSTFNLMQLAEAIHQFFAKEGYPKLKQEQLSPLDVAAESGNLELCKYIFGKMKNNVPAVRNRGFAMQLAALRGHLEIVKFLTENGVEKNPQDEKEWTLLHLVGRCGHFEIYKYISVGIDNKNPRCQAGLTPLHFAAGQGNLDVCKMIMENVQNRNPGNDNGDTPLHVAAKKGHLDVCKLIVESMLNKNIEVIQDHTQTDSVAVNGQICELINVNPMNNLGHTPLYLAEQRGNLKVCEYFISLVEKEKNQ